MMRSNLFICRFFVSGLVLSMLLLSPQLLDFFLLPRFISLSLVLAISCYLISRSKQVFAVHLDLISAPYLLYTVFCLLSVSWAVNTAESVFEALRTSLSFLVFLLSALLVKSKGDEFFKMFRYLSVAVFFIAATALVYQVLKLGSFHKEALYQLTGINGHKNLVASFLFLTLFFLVNTYRHSQGVWRILAAVAILLTFILLVFLRTKAVWAGALFGFCAFLALSQGLFLKKSSRLSTGLKLLGLLLLVNLFFVVGFNLVIHNALAFNESYEGLNQPLDQERLTIWDKTYDMVHKHLLVGVGAGNWQVYFPDATLSGLYRAEDLNFTFQRPHNDLLWILSETGLLGFNLFLVFLLGLGLCLMNALRNPATDKKNKTDLILCLAFVLSYFCIGFFDFPKERIEHNILINVIFGIAYAGLRQSVNVPLIRTVQAGRGIFFCVFLLLLFSAVVGALRYKGEFYTRKMYDHKNANDAEGLISAGKSAQNIFYSLDPTSMPLYWYLGNTEATRNNYAGALSFLKKAYALHPYNRNVLNDLASAYEANQNSDMAKIYYREAIRISPRFDDPKLNLAAIYIRQKDYKKAEACIDSLYHNSERRSQYRKIISAFK